MADRIIEVLTPATSFDLMTLDEAKLMMGLSTLDTSDDAQLQLFIDINSATVMRMCNRIFALEEVREEWRELNGGHRIFPSHWPIKQADLESVESPAGTALDPSNYELEEDSGKIEIFSAVAWTEPVVVQYWGGYELPDDAPLPLKQAVAMLNVRSKLLASLGTIAGIRQLSHKEGRIAFHDPSKLLGIAFGGGGAGGIDAAIMSVLSHYIHYEV
jgi:hypothetical protein